MPHRKIMRNYEWTILELQIPLNAGTTESPHPEAAPDLETTLDFFYLNPTQEANIVGENLSGHIYPDEDFGKKAFLGKVPCEEVVEEFLLHCPLYDNVSKRWSNILNENIQYDSALYTPVYDIFNAVVTHFQYHGSRVLFDTPHKYLIPDEEITCNSETRCWKSSPEIMVLATASGEMVQPWETDYPHCIAPIEIQTQKNANRSLEENIIQIGIYARQCFIRQNNRKAVYSLLITEKNVQLFMFDRGGVYHSLEVDIHESATDFIRLILGVVSPNEDVVGYDSGVFWCGQSQRFIKTIDADGELEVYLLDSPTPVFSRGSIQGVSTCCWKGWGEGKEDVLVKDAWRLVTRRRTPETDFLTAAQGLVGVGQMISFEEGETISSLRGMDTEALPYNLKSKFRD
ncbi:hypothetical protein GALMADRAFT_386799 [Galerina marginata CBS 339.88]|uniref:Fungal-type protein kinase domain-containing protein n=1 Tax=Galerina marginata (strain CBS 339.88) TaxID=685588 RepID=A0A067TRG0_GALM3|nr:hypothetical protein GALMADRAFT_386799 [Galerina marginata CBS 339.88]